ncbi:E3 ubiquitin-protein ligase znrf2 isoform X3 [Pseudoliparis swirei]|uniref:E3 ubiquitin-protein ligase znrf2 isoform X3 n=1 Tax=Pseudoliparis swirei TaxID=2059687 RepID=UPI0024BEE4F0|nr:E3 ubiquitin-protein ligase znrf2 isoform X3 [Pseudoliparis swirei]
MGAKQSSPAAIPAANGRPRAYSGSDLPSSSSGSNGSRTTAGGVRYHAYGASGASSSTSQHHHGARARSVGIAGTRTQSGINIPNSSGAYSSQESGGSSPEEADRERSGGGHEGPRLLIGSLPAHLSPHLFAGTSPSGRSKALAHRSPSCIGNSLPRHCDTGRQAVHPLHGFKCPVCSKYVSSEDMDLHLVLCLTKPRVTYNAGGFCYEGARQP